MKTFGVLASYREEFILLQEKVISDEQFILYLFCIHQADWDEKHKSTYGTINMTNQELGIGLGWSEDKVCRNLKPLIKKEFLKKSGKIIEVIDFQRFLPKNAFPRTENGHETAYLREKIAKLRSQNAKMQNNSADLRNSTPNLATESTPISDTFPYKVNSSYSLVKRTFEDYRKIKERNGYAMLTEEDMKWINENVTEDLNISS